MKKIKKFSTEKIISLSLVSLINGISTFFRLFNAKAILLEELLWYYLTHSLEDNWVHTFPKGICPKVNEIARLEFELCVQRFNHYTTKTHPENFCCNNKLPLLIKLENLEVSIV